MNGCSWLEIAEGRPQFQRKIIVNWIHTMKKNIYTIDNAIDILCKLNLYY